MTSSSSAPWAREHIGRCIGAVCSKRFSRRDANVQGFSSFVSGLLCRLPDRNFGPVSALAENAYATNGMMTGARGQLHQPDETEAREAILVVEDEVLVRMVIADELRDAGYVVIEASNAQEALDLLRHGRVSVRLVFSDIRMPGHVDGLGLARIIRSEYPIIKIVLTSGHFTVLGGTDHEEFIAKPYQAARVINHIKTLLD